MSLRLASIPLQARVLIITLFIRGLPWRIIALVLPIYMRNVGISIADLGIIFSMWGFALMIFEPIWGTLCDRKGAKKIFLMSALFAPLMIFLYTIVTDVISFAALRFFEGIWMCANGVSSRKLTRGAFAGGGRAFGAWWAISSLAAIVGPFIGGFLANIDYILCFYLASIMAIIAIIPATKVRESKTKELEVDEEGGTSLSKKQKIGLIIPTFLVAPTFFAYFAFNTFLPVFAKESPKFLLNPSQIGLIFSVMNIVGVVAFLFFGELSDRVGRKKLIVPGMVFVGLAFLFLASSSDIILLNLTAIVMILGFSAVSPLMMALLTDNIPTSKQGVALGLYGAGEDLGIATGPLVVGYVYQLYGAESSFYLVSLLMLFTLIISIPLLKKI